MNATQLTFRRWAWPDSKPRPRGPQPGALGFGGGSRAGFVLREDSPGKMATAGSAERPGRAASAAGRYRSGPGAGCGSGSSPPENEGKKCPGCAEGQPGGSGGGSGSPPCGHPACPLRRAHRLSGSEERLRRRSDPERSSSRAGRRDCDSRRGWCVHRGGVSSQEHRVTLL